MMAPATPPDKPAVSPARQRLIDEADRLRKRRDKARADVAECSELLRDIEARLHRQTLVELIAVRDGARLTFHSPDKRLTGRWMQVCTVTAVKRVRVEVLFWDEDRTFDVPLEWIAPASTTEPSGFLLGGQR